MATPLSKGRTQGDIFRHVHHPSYCLVSAKLVNPDATARAAQSLLGQPVKASGANYVLVKSTDEAAAIGLVFSEGLIALGASEVTAKKYAILRRGPAVIDRDSLPANDVAGTAFDTVAELVTAYAALSPPIIPVDQPDTYSEQTT
jgi:hypothetical protein